MTEETFEIETTRTNYWEIDTITRIYKREASSNEKRFEVDPKTLWSPYRQFYNKVTKEHAKLIKKTKLEKVVTTFVI